MNKANLHDCKNETVGEQRRGEDENEGGQNGVTKFKKLSIYFYEKLKKTPNMKDYFLTDFFDKISRSSFVFHILSYFLKASLIKCL